MMNPLRRRRRLPKPVRDAGQAALVLILLISFLLVTVATTLAVSSEEHDPLVHEDALEHFAYRALEAGIDTLLSTLNTKPNLVNCSSTKTTQTCVNTTNGIKFDHWVTVTDTALTPGANEVPEHYLWTNPTFCFSKTKVVDTSCALRTTPTHKTTTNPARSGNLEYVRIEVIGAAGVGTSMDYATSVANFQPRNGFLTHVWWSNYSVVYPTLGGSSKGCPKTGNYDWTGTAYNTETPCTPVYFASRDKVVGPIFSNDSIYVTGGTTTKPTFNTPTGTHASPVTTADPNCLFVSGTFKTKANCATADSDVAKYTATESHHGSAYLEPIPSSDTALAALAADNGCLYTGPTVLSFFEKTTKPMMHVWSPETPRSGSTDSDDRSTNPYKADCLTATATETPTTVVEPVPTGLNTTTATHPPNGVIFVETNTGSSCAGNHDNPLDGYKETSKETLATRTKTAQIRAPGTGTAHGYNYTADVVTTVLKADCEGDAFVRDAKGGVTGETPGITGNVTVGAQNNIFVTGNLKYLNCKKVTGGAWTATHTCAYNTGASTRNDSLGLIATHFVELNHPGAPKCTTVVKTTNGKSTTTVTCKTTPTSLLADCTSATIHTLTATQCNPASNVSGASITIDAAILALRASFVVNNWSVKSTNTKPTTGSGTTGHLYIYGTIAQDYRGAVGTFSGTTMTSGYSKWYTFDSRLQYISVPEYLAPSTASWGLASSSVTLSTACPAKWPKPYSTTSTPGTVTGWPPTTTATPHTKVC